jgi:hypothetical protein
MARLAPPLLPSSTLPLSTLVLPVEVSTADPDTSCGPETAPPVFLGAPVDDNGPDVMGPDVMSPVAGNTGACGPEVLSEFEGCINGPEVLDGTPPPEDLLNSALRPKGPEWDLC